ncbi:PAP2-domain-containing protein [Amylocystis lapponica]|nr:PAP2-domain-containing protein [Amylocystis lapponica]
MTLPTPPTAPRTALDLTHVLYDESSHVSLALALLTLSPILLNPAYAALVVQTRELLFIEMWAGQMLCEAFNWVLKHIIKQERPSYDMGEGYGFPSSHSQWMGYFATFLLCHFSFRHRFVSTGWHALDLVWKIALYIGVASWAGAVALSRFYLSYHTAPQVLWGLGIGVLFGATYYILVEVIPSRHPHSFPGRARTAILVNPLFTWFRIRDGWAVWGDSGTEVQWLRWRQEWDRQRSGTGHSTKELKHD